MVKEKVSTVHTFQDDDGFMVTEAVKEVVTKKAPPKSSPPKTPTRASPRKKSHAASSQNKKQASITSFFKS